MATMEDGQAWADACSRCCWLGLARGLGGRAAAAGGGLSAPGAVGAGGTEERLAAGGGGGDRTPDGVQEFRAGCAGMPIASAMHLRTYVGEHLADLHGALVLDETGFLKKGDKSAGAAAAQRHGGTDRELPGWRVPGLCRRCGRALIDRRSTCPKGGRSGAAGRSGHPGRGRLRHQTEAGPGHARAGARRPVCRSPRLPQAAALADGSAAGRRVTGDSVYGADPALRRWLQARGLGYASRP